MHDRSPLIAAATPTDALSGVLYQSWPQCDGSYRIEYLSAGAEEILELSEYELAHRVSHRDLPLFGVDIDEFYRQIEISVRDHTSWRAEVGYIGPKTGRRRWFQVTDFPRRTPHNIPYFSGVMIDITAVKAAEANTLCTCQTLAGHLNNTPLAVIEWDHEFRVLRWSGQSERLFGWTAAEMMGRQPSDVGLVYQADTERVADTMGRLFRGVEPRNVLVSRNCHRSGRVLTVEWHNSAVHDSQGKPISFLSLVLDLTERVEIENELHRTEERLKTALRVSQQLVWDWDVSTNQMYYSQNFGEFFGAPEFGANPGRDVELNCAHPADRDRAIQGMAAALAADREIQFEFRGVADTPDGRPRWFEVHGQTVRDAEGQPIRMIGVTTDVTERKRAEEQRQAIEQQLNEARRYDSLGVMASGIAHDFNNLLTIILGQAGLARLKVSADPSLVTVFTEIEKAAQKAASLCSQLTAYAGVESMTLGPVDLEALLRQMEPALQTDVGVANLKMIWNSPLPSVLGEAFQIRQAIRSLVTNAGEAIGATGGSVVVEVAPIVVPSVDFPTIGAQLVPAPGRYVRVRVTDTGPGMSAEMVARAFEPFFSTKFIGRGLGLPAVRGIVKRHAGGLHLGSQPGRGTVVEVAFPIAPANEFDGPNRFTQRTKNPTVSSTEKPQSIVTQMVLVVDDEPNIRELVAMVLADSGRTVVVAADGAEAVQLFEAQADRFALAVIDLMMPGMNGRDLLQVLRERRPRLPVVVVSGFSDWDLIAEFRPSGPITQLTKPFRIEQLLTAIAAVVEPVG